MFVHSLAQWTIPTVSGDIPPPISYFSFTQISSDEAVMFGGDTPTGLSSRLFLATVFRDSVVCETWWWLSFDCCYGMFGLASEAVEKVVVGVVIGCGLGFEQLQQNFTIVYTVLFLLQHWQRLASHRPDRPEPRCNHAATSFTQSQLSSLLLVGGGVRSEGGWIFDMRTMTWEKVSVANNWALTHALTRNIHSS